MIDFLEKNIIKICVLIFIIIIVIIITMFVIKKTKQDEFLNQEVKNEVDLKVMEQSYSYTSYFILNNCINKYYSFISKIQNNTGDQDAQLLDILNKEYIQDNNININNYKEIYGDYNYNGFIIEKMYITSCDNNISIFLIYGKQYQKDTNISENYGFAIIIDGSVNSFSIAPYEFIKQRNISENTDIAKLIDVSNIKKNSNNSFTYPVADKEQEVKNIYNDYKTIAKYDPEYAYSLLDEDYRKARFIDEDTAKKYLQQNIEKILGTIVNITYDDSDTNVTKYMCKDSLGNIIVINKNDQIMKYSIILDIYTIPIDSYISAYNKASTSKKTAYQIELFKQRINLKDYDSAYNLLDKSFRDNNFGSVENFVKYINNNWYEFINITSNEFKLVNDIGTMNVSIKNRNSEDSNVVLKTFIVKLNNDGTCTMSFNVE